jgi:bacterial leucyl aminopeptidase
MFKKNLPYFYALAAVFVLAAVFALSFNKTGAHADLIEFYVSIDDNELQTVVNQEGAAGRNLDFQAVNVKNGIAVIKTTNGELEKLSTLMHENFHKCAGFIAHETEAEALKSIDDSFTADTQTRLVDYTIDNQTNVNPMLAEVQEPQIRQTITDLSAFPNRRYNQTSGLNSANWIKDRWTAMTAGRSDIAVEFFTHPAATSPQPSVIMTITGTTTPNEVVVLGGHQDSINGSGATLNAPGADDDASGIASLTEVIRILVAKNFRPQRTIKFMAYAAEEVGLRGSAAIALDYQTRAVNVVGVMQLDMTNYKGSAADIVLITDRTNAAQNQFLRTLIAAYQPTITTIDNTCGYACSDHASWTTRGYAASMPFEARISPVEDNPFIHTANDTLDKSGNNANHAVKFTKLAVSYVGELAKGALATTAPNRQKFDYDGDGKADVSVFRPSSGAWYLNQSSAGFAGISFGQAGDKLVPADYDGDGKTDVAVYRDGIWYLNRSQAGFTGIQFGNADDIPVPADYSGDGKAEIAVFRPSNNYWYSLNLANNRIDSIAFGTAGDKPVPADYDGDGDANIAVFRPSSGTWFTSTDAAINYGAVQFGAADDKLVPADYDGDGKADVAVYRGGTWYLNRSRDGFVGVAFGLAGDLPVAADYDGDGKADVSVYRGGTWYLNRSTTGFTGIAFGANTDTPTPNVFVP